MDLTSAELALSSLQRRCAGEEELSAAKDLGLLVRSNGRVEKSFENGAKVLLESSQWEPRAAGFMAASVLLPRETMESGKDLWDLVASAAERNLEDREPRVRTTVVKAVEALAKLDGPASWSRFGQVLCNIIEKSFALDEEERMKTHSELAAQEVQRLHAKTSIPTLVHETIGWKALETSMRGLEALIRGYGPDFATDGHLEWNNQYIVDLVSNRGLKHENRYVREVTYDLCAVIASAVCGASKGMRTPVTDAIVPAVTKGLQDNWSQVRFAASVAARNLVLGLDHAERGPYLPDLVPRMCLNRYYLAEGVKLYSQETWRLAFPGEGSGVQMVCDQIVPVVDFYCLQSQADNHGVREAACFCIAEVSAKVPKEVLSPHVEKLLKALIDCFRDDSWPVRDAACVATGRFVTNFPTESKHFLDELLTLWFDHLSDNIWSVREDSAMALGQVMTAFPLEGVTAVKEKLPQLLAKVHEQDVAEVHHGHSHGSESEHASSEAEVKTGLSIKTDAPTAPESRVFLRLSSPRSMAGAESVPRNIVSGMLSDLHTKNDESDDRHSNQLMFSCGSLAPKLKRRGVGCMDHGYTRPKKNWEITDGGIYLLREFATLFPADAEKYMEALSKTIKTPYAEPDLRVTLWKQLTRIATALGKRPFKRYLEFFLPSLISDLSHENQLAASAAADCLTFFMGYLGRNILQGRVEGLLDGERLWSTVLACPLVQMP